MLIFASFLGIFPIRNGRREEVEVQEDTDKQMDNESECEKNNQRGEQGQTKVSHKSESVFQKLIPCRHDHMLLRQILYNVIVLVSQRNGPQ